VAVREALVMLSGMEPAEAERTVVTLLEAARSGELSLWQVLGYTPEQLYDIYSKAHFLYKGGRPKNAAVLCEGLLALEPASVEARLLLAGCHVELQEYDKALSAFDALLRAEPGNLDALVGKGLVLQRKKRLVEAGLLFQKVVELDAGARCEAAQQAAKSLAVLQEHFGA
jgi:tetratricopeptide (TPR) repeat protein